MTKPHPAHLAFTVLFMLLAGLPLASRAGEPLIVVEDRGGVGGHCRTTKPLNLQPRANAPARPPIPTPRVPPRQRTKPRCRWCAAPSSRLYRRRGG